MRAPLLVVALAAACGGSPSKTNAPAPAAVVEPPAAAPTFLLASLEIDKDLSLTAQEVDGKRAPRWKAKLVIDGHVTRATWPEHPPAAYRIDDDRWLLHDRYNEYRLYIWESHSTRLTDLGRGTLIGVAGMGHLVALYAEAGEPMRFSEIHPTLPQLRTIWEPKKARDRASVIGVHDGAIVIALHELQWSGKFSEDATLHFVKPGDSVERHVGLSGWRVASGDSIRDGRILLLGQQNASGFGSTGWVQPFSANLALYDLATDEIRELDPATGDYTQYTAIPHPYVHVAWTTEAALESSPRTFGTGWDCVTYVIEKTEEVRALGCTTAVPLNATNSVP